MTAILNHAITVGDVLLAIAAIVSVPVGFVVFFLVVLTIKEGGGRRDV